MVWGLALALVVGVAATIELAARARGFQPSVKDTPALWSAYRERARTPAGPQAPLVLIGSSRFMLGINHTTLAASVRRPVINLAIDGSSPRRVFEDLVRDQSFHGTILREMHAFAKEGPSADAKPNEYIQYFHARTWMSDTEALLRERVQSNLTILLPEVGPRQILNGLVSRHLDFQPSYVRMLPGRHRPADYSRVDLEQHRRHWADASRNVGPRLDDSEVVALADEISEGTDKLRSRGGDVILFRMVSSGAVRAIEEERTPRAQWDLFAARVRARAIHYADIPALRDFVAVDGSHLDQRDVEAFSGALGTTLTDLGGYGQSAVEIHRPK